ncbi:hypothetical protein [Acidithiobacillus sp.]|uniref:hypothetical protein n=1 Tax=Acidithiobacillus sp. TaxID=1872118 RepID=UPI003CFC838A
MQNLRLLRPHATKANQADTTIWREVARIVYPVDDFARERSPHNPRPKARATKGPLSPGGSAGCGRQAGTGTG